MCNELHDEIYPSSSIAFFRKKLQSYFFACPPKSLFYCFSMVLNLYFAPAFLYPWDSIQWILWTMHEYAATVVCRDFLVTCLEARVGRLLKFSGYIHNHKILPGNIFSLILRRFLTFSKEFCWPSRTKVIIVRDLKYAGYVHYYKIFIENIFGFISNKMAAIGVSFQS